MDLQPHDLYFLHSKLFLAASQPIHDFSLVGLLMRRRAQVGTAVIYSQRYSLHIAYSTANIGDRGATRGRIVWKPP